MVTHVMLMNFTEQGIKSVKNAPQRVQDGIKAFEQMGGTVLAFYATVGPYDYVAIGEAPTEEAGVAFALALSAQGNVRTTTMRAFKPEEFEKIVGSLP